MAISNEYRVKFAKQVALFNEVNAAIQKIHRAFQCGQQEVSPDNPHSANKTDTGFDTAHTVIIEAGIAEMQAKLNALKADVTA